MGFKMMKKGCCLSMLVCHNAVDNINYETTTQTSGIL